MQYLIGSQDLNEHNLNFILRHSGFKAILGVSQRPIQIMGAVSQIAHVQLSYDQSTVGINPKSVFVKYNKSYNQKFNHIEILIKQLHFNRNEMQTYKLLREFKFQLIPEIYYSFLDADQNYTIIMQDLQPDYKMLRQQQLIHLSDIKRLMKQVAQLHCLFMNKEQLKYRFSWYYQYQCLVKAQFCINPSLVFDDQYVRKQAQLAQFELQRFIIKFNKIEFENTSMSYLKDLFKDIKISEIIDSLSEIDNFFSDSKLFTLLHMDLKNENLFFGHHDIKIVDWQTASLGHPFIELVRMLVSCLSIDQLKSDFSELIKYYICQLENGLGRTFTQSEVRKWIKSAILQQIKLSIIFMQDMQDYTSEEISESMRSDQLSQSHIKILLNQITKTFSFYSLAHIY